MKDPYLHSFLESFDEGSEKALMESIRKGYSCIFEGYEDPRDIEQEDAVTQFNRMGAYNSNFGVNPIMAFLQQSGERLRDRYSEDPNPELDSVTMTVHYEPTDDRANDGYDDYDEYNTPETDDSYDTGFGLTNRDMSDLS